MVHAKDNSRVRTATHMGLSLEKQHIIKSE